MMPATVIVVIHSLVCLASGVMAAFVVSEIKEARAKYPLFFMLLSLPFVSLFVLLPLIGL